MEALLWADVTLNHGNPKDALLNFFFLLLCIAKNQSETCDNASGGSKFSKSSIKIQISVWESSLISWDLWCPVIWGNWSGTVWPSWLVAFGGNTELIVFVGGHTEELDVCLKTSELWSLWVWRASSGSECRHRCGEGTGPQTEHKELLSPTSAAAGGNKASLWPRSGGQRSVRSSVISIVSAVYLCNVKNQ